MNASEITMKFYNELSKLSVEELQEARRKGAEWLQEQGASEQAHQYWDMLVEAVLKRKQREEDEKASPNNSH